MQFSTWAIRPFFVSPKVLAGVSITLYVSSLTQAAIALRNPGGADHYHALMMLLAGAIGFLGGAIPEWIIWLANPLYFTSILLLFRRNKLGMKTSLAASLLAASFAGWNEILVSESGRNAPIIALEPGYYLWLAGLLILTGAWVIQFLGDHRQQETQDNVRTFQKRMLQEMKSLRKQLLVIPVLLLTMVACNTPQENNGTEAMTVVTNTTGKTVGQLKGGWAGSWEVRSTFEAATLEITHHTADSLVFTLFASSGGHLGEIAGCAKGDADLATFLSAQEGDRCLITFRLRGDTLIEVNQQSGLCSAGMGVTYTGAYRKAGTTPRSVETLITIGILKNNQEETQFRHLVGNDYDLFLNSSQLTAEDSDLDSLAARVHTSGVRGLFTLAENIIMVNGQGQMWAAVIDDDSVYYYTNSDAYKDTLPRTIDKWRERFANKPVLYKGVNKEVEN
ncbi:MAG: hypothetical protein ICV83_14170 [Cytophagales bacterium]|nr:hypothetical protein [Cytophagales bacterium]